MAIRGLTQARKNTQRLFRHQIPERAHKTIVEVLIMGRTFTLMTVPVDTGNLINSAFIDHGRNSKGAWGRFGFTAAYAAAVHSAPGTMRGLPRERPGAGNYWDPDGEPYFLSKGFEANLGTLDAIVQRGMKL